MSFLSELERQHLLQVQSQMSSFATTQNLPSTNKSQHQQEQTPDLVNTTTASSTTDRGDSVMDKEATVQCRTPAVKTNGKDKKKVNRSNPTEVGKSSCSTHKQLLRRTTSIPSSKKDPQGGEDVEDGGMSVLDVAVRDAVPFSFQSSSDNDYEKLVSVLPNYIQTFMEKHRALYHQSLTEVVMDVGRGPLCFCSTPGKTELTREEILGHYPPLQPNQLQSVIENVSTFSESDNRAGINGTLHRVSRKLNRGKEVIGLTIRMGRSVMGLYKLLESELLSGKSILLLGRPGSGKTTFIRDCARFLAESKRVEIVDTSNEIAGDGDIPHVTIGQSRRMMVPVRAQQHHVMLEAVQNHTPEVLVIDEIGTMNEVSAARDISQRGVQLIATAHGTCVSDVTDSPILVKLVGDVHSVILNGRETIERNAASKTARERVGNACFQIVVEIRRPGVIVVLTPTNQIIDSLLNQRPYEAELRVFSDFSETTGPVITSQRIIVQ